jgi:hypothetical protein
VTAAPLSVATTAAETPGPRSEVPAGQKSGPVLSESGLSGQSLSGRSPLAQLLHALNQPLTGLQCSLEVALAAPRTREQYLQNLRDALTLTERMRPLAEGIRVVVDSSEKTMAMRTKEEPGGGALSGDADAATLGTALRESAEELKPVAAIKNVTIAWAVRADCDTPRRVEVSRQSSVTQGVFRLLESVLALASRSTLLRIEAGPAGDEWFRIQWRTFPRDIHPPLSLPELGLLIAQAQLEQSRVVWERRRTESDNIVTLRLPVAPVRGSL